MSRTELLAMLALISRKKADAIQGHMSLTSLGISSSFGVSALKSRLEGAQGRRMPFINANTTVDQLFGIVEGGGQSENVGAASPPRPRAPAVEQRAVPVQPAVQLGVLGVGIDLEEIAHFPEAVDFRSDPFYARHFHPSEIASAMLKADPRASLCGIFCVKEAAKKSHDLLLNLSMDQMLVIHADNGRPMLTLVNCAEDLQRLSFQISLSHTANYATAVCMTSWSAA